MTVPTARGTDYLKTMNAKLISWSEQGKKSRKRIPKYLLLKSKKSDLIPIHIYLKPQIIFSWIFSPSFFLFFSPFISIFHQLNLLFSLQDPICHSSHAIFNLRIKKYLNFIIFFHHFLTESKLANCFGIRRIYICQHTKRV